jgi:hypothetical protein
MTLKEMVVFEACAADNPYEFKATASGALGGRIVSPPQGTCRNIKKKGE